MVLCSELARQLVPLGSECCLPASWPLMPWRQPGAEMCQSRNLSSPPCHSHVSATVVFGSRRCRTRASGCQAMAVSSWSRRLMLQACV